MYYLKREVLELGNEEILEQLQNERFKKIYNLIDEALANAKSEDDCTDEENEVYADMQNLKESMRNLNL